MIKKNKKIGQCFLKDKNIVSKIIDSANINKNDTILEIGLGEGILTKELSKLSKKVYVIELDKKLEIYADEILSNYKNVEIIWDDALKVNLHNLNYNKVVANLPYQISSPITFKLIDRNFDLAVLMYQYEFAKRMVAKENTVEYGRLSVMVQYFCDVELLFKVPKTVFSPKPKVDSAVVRLTPKKNAYPIKNMDFFKNMVKAIFQHKNKSIKKGLIHSAHEMNIDREKLKSILNEIDFNLEQKVFKTPPTEIYKLANILYDGISNSN